jgi:2-C-methyl-D-erythritol 2,4-cyclodiphosphate synthase
MSRMDFRIGQGFDVHAFCAGEHVMLGGVRVPHSAGLSAYSDGDVVLHALCDALLGAAALGDIGTHFPPDEPRWQNADSRELLDRVMRLLGAQGWGVVNADITVVCEQPRVSPHVDAMRGIMAAAMGIGTGQVSVKATTTEGLGFCGRGEGIAASATVLLTRETAGP